MAKRPHDSGTESQVDPDLTPLIDVCFQLITFFVMLMTIAKDEQARKVRLPIAETPSIIEEEAIPDSFSINVDRYSNCLAWGLTIPLANDNEQGWQLLESQVRNEVAISKANHPDWKQTGLQTTVIVRIDIAVEYEIFRKIIQLCQKNGLTKFQLKAKSPEDANASS